MGNGFDWDAWLSKAKYSDVVDLSPALSNDHPLPMYSSDRKHLHLGFTDNYVSVEDEKELKDQLRQLKGQFMEAQNQQDYKRAWILQVVCQEICALLSDLVVVPEEYFNHEKYLE